MQNIPVIKIGIVAVSRDCFPESLAVNRRKAVIAEYEKKFGKEGIYECPRTSQRLAVTPSAFTLATLVLRFLRLCWLTGSKVQLCSSLLLKRLRKT